MQDYGAPTGFRLTEIKFDLITAIITMPVALFVAGSTPYLMREGAAQIVDGFEPINCPPQIQSGPPKNCDDVKEMA